MASYARSAGGNATPRSVEAQGGAGPPPGCPPRCAPSFHLSRPVGVGVEQPDDDVASSIAEVCESPRREVKDEKDSGPVHQQLTDPADEILAEVDVKGAQQRD